MKQHELFSYTYDFLSQLMDHEEIISSVKRIILFGSVVRGDFHDESDVDIFVDVAESKKRGIQKIINLELELFEKKNQKAWDLRNITPPLKIMIGSLQESRWDDLRNEIALYGKIIYAPFEETPHALHHYILLSYEPKKLKQKDKMALLRKIFGYTSKKGKKNYVQEGLLKEVEGTKIGVNSLLIPRGKVKEIRNLFKKYIVPHTVKDVWI